jgi:MoaA/NifB/PqqE/SkfB family radical SAM enzyme
MSVPAYRELDPQELDPLLYIGKPEYIRRFVMELTNHCNLRCLYCHQNKPDFQPTDPLSDETFNDILKYLSRHPVEVIDLRGGGDILMYSDWARKCDKLLALGIKLDTTINLGKLLEDHEVETLSRFNLVTVSTDTIHRKTLSQVQKR